MLRLTLTRASDERNACGLWCLFFLIVAVGILAGDNRSVTYQYEWAAEHWLAGTDLYETGGRGFLYMPQGAILFIPFSLLPNVLTEIVWRMLTIGVFASGVLRFCRLAQMSAGVRLFPLVTLMTIPLSFSAARNGQATLIIAGLMMHALEALTRQKWNRAAILLCFGLACKPLTLVLILLAAALYRPMLGRLLAGTALLLVIPYATQDPNYVTSQYVAFADKMRTAVNMGIDRPWAHLFGMLQTAGIEIPEAVQTAVRILAASVTLVVAWLAQRRLPAPRFALYLFGLAGCYLMLFNPRTENNTYAMIAPVIGVLCAEAFLVERNRLLGTLLAVMAVGTVGSYEIGIRLAPNANPVWLAPLMCAGFTVALVGQIFREIRAHAAPALEPAQPVVWAPTPGIRVG